MYEEQFVKREIQPLEEFNTSLKELSKEITKNNNTMFQIYDIIINKQLDIIHLNYILSKYRSNVFINEITSLVYKNLISILSAISLIKAGYIGTARMIFRNIYENLLIGKIFAVTKDQELFEKWDQGKQISIKKDVFIKLKNKTSKESIEFWDTLNKYNHGTIYSQNFGLEYDKNIIGDCNTFISVLLEMNYHLLNRFICQYRNYYLELYFGNHYKNLKKSSTEIFNISRPIIDKRCRKVLQDYKTIWKLA